MIDDVFLQDPRRAPAAGDHPGEGGALPAAVRHALARGEPIRHGVRACALGQVLVAATGRGVCMVAFDDREDALRAVMHARFGAGSFVSPDAPFDGWFERVLAAIASPQAAAGVPLDMRGSTFQHTVWQALRGIPSGTTATYGGVAERIGRPGAARAVARACAGNPVALLVPCHRVVRGDGGLGGYRWGLERKQRLLALERR